MKYLIGFLISFLFTACAGADAITPIAPSPTETAKLATVSATTVPTNLPATITSTPISLPAPTVTPSSTDVFVLQSDGDSYSPEISDNGRYIAFISRGKLTENSIHGVEFLYVYDRETEQIELASVALDGNSSEGRPFHISLSSSGRYVGFHSHGGDLVVRDDELCDSGMSNCADLFIYDRQLKKMIRIPHGSPTGERWRYTPWMTFSPDEQYFFSNGVRDLEKGQYFDLNTGELLPKKPVIDYLLPDGTTAYFWNSKENNSEEDNLVEPINASEILNLGDTSGGGVLVAFSSMPTDLTDNPISLCEDVTWNAEGLRPCFNIFIHSLETRETWLATVGKDGWSSNGDTSWPMMSLNGRFLTFHTEATNLTDDDFSECISGGYRGLECFNVYLQDLQTGETILISRELDSNLPAGYSRIGDISGDGRFVTFYSESEKLVHHDTNEVSDVFVYDRLTEDITRISVPNAP